MSSELAFPDSLMDSLQVAAQQLGISPHAVTWSSVSGTVIAATALALFFSRFAYKGTRPPTPLPKEEEKEKEEKPKLTPAMQKVHDTVNSQKRPEDGSVRVAEILIHPIKSCRGSSVQSCKYTPLGLTNDREWCFIDATSNRIITAREFPRIVLIHPYIEPDHTDPNGGTLLVTFPPDAPEGCKEFRVPLHPSDELLEGWEILEKCGLFSEILDAYVGHALPLVSPVPTTSLASTICSIYFGKPVHLAFKGPSARPAEPTPLYPALSVSFMFQDGYPLLVLSKESMEALEGEVRSRVGAQGMGVDEAWREGKVQIRRFRPNVVFEGGGAFAEDAWEEVCIGSRDAPVVSLVSRCVRCLLPNISPDTAERDKAVPYKVLMKFRIGLDPIEKMKPCVGCNGIFGGSGVVNVGDVVYIKKMVRLL